MMDENLKRTILLDHYSHPRNKGLSDDPTYRTLHMASDSCIDDIKVQVKVKDGIVEDLRFDGVGCTISFASTSIFTELLKGKSVKEALALIEEYYAMLDEKTYNPEDLEEANAFDTLYKQANRIKCGTIGVKGIEELIRESVKNEK